MRALALALCCVAQIALAQNGSVTTVLEPSQAVALRSTVNGRITQITTQEGAQIKAGDLLAEVDAQVQTARVALSRVVAEAKGSLLRAERLLEQTETRRDRIATARESGAAQGWELTAAEQAVAVAQADLAVVRDDLQRREAELALEQAMLAEFRLEAPFDATVLEVMVDPGEVVETGAVILEIGNIDTLNATAFAPVDWLDALRPEARLTAETDTGARVEVTVEALDPRIDPASRTLRVILRLDNRDAQFRPGMILDLLEPQ